MDARLLGTAAAFGLAASVGLNTTLPLLLVGVLTRLGLVHVSPPYDAIASNPALAGLALLAVLEIIADKIPGLASLVHAVQWPLAAAAGAILFASQTSVVSWVSPGLAIIVGLLTAGAVHGARASARPAVTLATAGLGDPVVSSIEDVGAVALAALAVFAPLVGLVVLALVLALMAGWVFWLLPRTLRLSRRVGRALRPSP